MTDITNCARGILDFLYDRFVFELDKSARLICSVACYADKTGEITCSPKCCPGILVFLGAYLDRYGFSDEETLSYQKSLLEGFASIDKSKSNESMNCLDKIGINCVHFDMADILLYTADFISKNIVTMRSRRSEATEKPKQYYGEIYKDREQMFRHTSYALEERLINAVTTGDEDTAVFVLKEINRSGNKAVLASDSVRSAKNSIICTCVFLARATIRVGVATDEAFALSDAIIRRIEEFQSKEDTLAYEETLLIQFIQLIHRKKLSGFPRVIHRAIHYIDAHLSEKLRLGDIALYSGVTPQYLSGLFSREMHMGITNYISKRKVQESTYFISHKDYSIADVAALYGFSGQSYYITVFKKFMGMTPGEYREKSY